jgi:malate synthase
MVIPLVKIEAPDEEESSGILTPEALGFVATLEGVFGERRLELLQLRQEKWGLLDRGVKPVFPVETKKVRNDQAWRVGTIPADLLDRRVEITGPSGDRKMVINALNSGANVYMADFEDSQSPTWLNNIRGQVNLRDVVMGTITYTDPVGKSYSLNQDIAVLMVRPRGWHLVESHVKVKGRPVSASLFDFGLFYFLNARDLVKKGTGPYFYLPKLEGYLEARLWNDVFDHSEDQMGLPRGTIKATVLVETILAAYEMEEILYELREHIVGLNAGRWDYIFSVIKEFRNDPTMVMPDRNVLTMDKAFLSTYVRLLIRMSHKRGAHAIGGMSAYIPVKDAEANKQAFDQVRTDKLREVTEGHDGTWVAHPGLVSIARSVFDEHMPSPNQLSNKREDVMENLDGLLMVPEGSATETGLRNNVSVALQYIAGWLGGQGAVAINNLMEDTATAEIARAQVWQWVRHGSRLSDGRHVTEELVGAIVRDELSKIEEREGAFSFNLHNYPEASRVFLKLVGSEEFADFLTLIAYPELLKHEITHRKLTGDF